MILYGFVVTNNIVVCNLVTTFYIYSIFLYNYFEKFMMRCIFFTQ